MYQITAKCNVLRLVEQYDCDNMTAKGSVKPENITTYTEAHFEAHENKTNLFFSFPVELLGNDIQINDEILVTFERKNK